MGADNKEDVDADSAEFKQGVEAGLNSEDDTKNWKAGNELGRELKGEGEMKAPAYGNAKAAPPTPLFMSRDSESEGTDQDEKDETAE